MQPAYDARHKIYDGRLRGNALDCFILSLEPVSCVSGFPRQLERVDIPRYRCSCLPKPAEWFPSLEGNHSAGFERVTSYCLQEGMIQRMSRRQPRMLPASKISRLQQCTAEKEAWHSQLPLTSPEAAEDSRDMAAALPGP